MIILLCLSVISCQKNEEQEVVVIGGGLMGSSAAWQLSRAGNKVVLLEKQDSIYSSGSSFGEARISRSLGSKNDVFSYLQQTSVAEIQILINSLNEAEGNQVHRMEDIFTTSPVTYIYYKSQQAELDHILNGQADRYEYAPDSQKALDMFNMKVADSIMVVREYKKHSGTLNPKVLISKLHQGIRNNGGTIRYNEKVTNLQKRNNHYEIQMTNAVTGVATTVKSKKVVSAAGPYTGELLKNIAPEFAKLIRIKRLVLAFFKIRGEAYNGLSEEIKRRIKDSYPVADLNKDIFYSMIEKYDEDNVPILKVGGHFLRSDIKNLDEVWQKELSENEVNWSKDHLAKYFSQLNIQLGTNDLNYYKGYSCVYSLTESEIPYVSNILDNDEHPDTKFVMMGGMSGIGAKGSLAYGLLASDILRGRQDTSYMYQKAKATLSINRSEDNLTLYKK